MHKQPPIKSKAEKWYTLIELQQRSGKTVRDFCVEHQINKNTFCYWQKKKRLIDLSAKAMQSKGSESRFVALTSRLNSSSPRIVLPNGVSIELSESLDSVAVSQLILRLCGVDHAKA